MVRDGPVVDLGQIVFVDEFRQRAAPVMARLLGFRRATGCNLGKVRNQVVAAPLLELGCQLRSPVRPICLKRIGKDSVRRRIAESLQKRLADLRKMRCHGLMTEWVEHPAFRSNRGPLDNLSRVTCDEEERGARFAGWRNRRCATRNFKRLHRRQIPIHGLRRCVGSA